METNWNQLIELYLQNELSEEGKSAFEQELSINPELREELETHQLIQSAAKRASQRNMIKNTGKLYLRNLRIKQFTVGVVVSAIAAVGIIYWLQNQNGTSKRTSEADALKIKESTEELICRADQINHQPNQTGGKSSLIQPTDWQKAGESVTETKISSDFTLGKRSAASNDRINTKEEVVKNQSSASLKDSVPLTKPTVTVLGYTNDKLEGEAVESTTNRSSLQGAAWVLRYDSVGKFNDLYCGYALVMDKSKFGFVDPEGKIFIPIIYDQLVVTTSIKSSKQKNKRQKKKKVLYIPKRSGKDVKDCEEGVVKVFIEQESVPIESIKSK